MKAYATLATTAAFLLAAAPQGRAAISMVISDNGTDLTMVATGSYDLSNAAFAGNGSLGANAAVAPPIGNIYGWGTSGPTYTAAYAGSLSGTGFTVNASTASANIPFLVTRDNLVIAFASAAPTTGTVNNTATFNGVTLASLGMVAGQSMTGTWGLGGPDERITVSVVPEPSALLLSALGSLFLLRRKR